MTPSDGVGGVTGLPFSNACRAYVTSWASIARPEAVRCAGSRTPTPVISVGACGGCSFNRYRVSAPCSTPR